MVYFHYFLISFNNMPFVVSYSSLVVSRTLRMGTESVPEMLERFYTMALLYAPRIFY